LCYYLQINMVILSFMIIYISVKQQVNREISKGYKP
jgi:hypothetical protein